MFEKDLVRKMMKPDPAERASIPEVLNHAWMQLSGPSLELSGSLGGHLTAGLRSRKVCTY